LNLSKSLSLSLLRNPLENLLMQGLNLLQTSLLTRQANRIKHWTPVQRFVVEPTLSAFRRRANVLARLVIREMQTKVARRSQSLRAGSVLPANRTEIAGTKGGFA
jgi:uncharacterized protein YaaW (UPF0174 family)